MEKILFVLDDRKVDESALRFACYLSRLTRSRLTGVFLESPERDEEIIVAQAEGVAVLKSVLITSGRTPAEKAKTRQGNLRRFDEIASAEGIAATVVYPETVMPAGEMIARSRFSDVLVLDGATSFSLFYESHPTRFTKELLQEAECPVILAPHSFTDIDNIVFCYDGGKSSLFAIKQFIYLFPELRNKRVKLLYIGKGRDAAEEEQRDLGDWLKYHYNDVELLQLDNDSTGAFIDYLRKKKNDFVVMGAYGKGLLASFFEDASGGHPGRTTGMPVFVAHY